MRCSSSRCWGINKPTSTRAGLLRSLLNGQCKWGHNRPLFKANLIQIRDITAFDVLCLEYFWVPEQTNNVRICWKASGISTFWEDYRQLAHHYGYVTFSINLKADFTSVLSAHIFSAILYSAGRVHNSCEWKIMFSYKITMRAPVLWTKRIGVLGNYLGRILQKKKSVNQKDAIKSSWKREKSSPPTDQK